MEGRDAAETAPPTGDGYRHSNVEAVVVLVGQVEPGIEFFIAFPGRYLPEHDIGRMAEGQRSIDPVIMGMA